MSIGFSKTSKKLIICIGIVLILLSICISIDYASNNDSIIVTKNQTQPKMTGNAIIINGTYYYLPNESGVAKLNKVVTEKPKVPIITITARPSCSCGKYYSYRWRTRSFVNYCPHCHRYGALYNKHKYQARHEQELTCRYDDCDYCGNCGKEKYSWSRYYLKKA